MNLSEIQELQSLHEYPSVSILLPTYRHSPEDLQQNPVRVKNLVRQMTDRLNNEVSQEEAAPLLQRMQELTHDIDFSHPGDGLALFVNKNFARVMYLPFQVPERVVINNHFATRDLLVAHARTPRYWTLVLSERMTRLFQGQDGKLMEVTSGGFPLPLEIPGVVTESGGNFGVEQSALRNEDDRHYFQRVDKHFGDVAGQDSLPLAVVGIERDLAVFKEVTKHGDQIHATIQGRHRETTAAALVDLVWPAMAEALKAKQQDVLQRLDSAIGADRFAAGVERIWKLAQEGRINTLVVEEDFRYPARLSNSGERIIATDGATGPNGMDDAVEEIIETVLDKKGQVAFVAQGSLKEHGSIAAVRRY